MGLLNDIQLSAIDWNLLRVFDALYRERSVVRAAERLHLSPSAVSHSLNRLRHLFADELFIRVATGMQPSPRAEEVGGRLHHALEQVQLALDRSGFDPTRQARRFHVACTNYASAFLAPRIISHVRRTAPDVGLSLHPFDLATLGELDSGRLDLVIAAPDRLSDRFRSERLFRERMVWVMRKDHPQAGRPLTVKRLAALPRLVIGARYGIGVADGTMLDDGPGRQLDTADAPALRQMLAGTSGGAPLFSTSNALGAAAIVAASDVVALLPRRLAEGEAGRYALKLFEPPYPVPPFEHAMIWRSDLGGHPGADWLRTMFRDAGRQLDEAPGDDGSAPAH